MIEGMTNLPPQRGSSWRFVCRSRPGTQLNYFQQTWTEAVRTAWHINPAISIYLTERFKVPAARNEVGRLVRMATADVVHIPEALAFLLHSSGSFLRRDLRVRMEFWNFSQANPSRSI